MRAPLERASSAMNEALGVATVLCLRSPGWRPCHRRFCAGSGV